MATSKISWIHCLFQFGYILAAVTAQEDCMMETFDDDGMINITPRDAYYQRNSEHMYCWMIELPQNSNANDFIRINITYVSLRLMDGLCFDTFSITEVCGNMSKAEVTEEMCSCSGNCNSPISWSASLGCDLKVLLAKGSRNGRTERFGFDVNFSLESDPLVPNAPLSTTNAATSSQSFSYESDPLVSNTPSPMTNAPNLSTSLKVLVTISVLLIMILVVALTVSYFIRYYRRHKSDEEVASNTTFNNASFHQYDEVNENPHEYSTHIHAELSQEQHEESMSANQGQTSHVTHVTNGNDSSNPVKPTDESKYDYSEPRIHEYSNIRDFKQLQRIKRYKE